MSNSGVYAITHVYSGRVYVGSSVNIRVRWLEHRNDLKQLRHTNKRLQNAWCKYGGHSFSFAILELVQDKKDLVLREQHWIDAMRAAVKPNFNICQVAGSTLGYTPSVETRTKISIASSRPRKPLSPEHRALLSAKATGRKMHPNTIAAMRAAMLGKKYPPEFGAAISKRLKGRVFSEDTIAKMSLAAKSRTEAHRAKHAEAARKNNTVSHLNTPGAAAKRLVALRSAEVRAKISAGLKGRAKSAAHVAKIVAATKATKARKKAELRLAQ